jgi:transposase-like protein
VKSETPATQATAVVALTNLIKEARTNKSDDYSDIIQKVAKAEIEISEEAQNYARYPIAKLVSPSDEAQSTIGDADEDEE